MKRFLYVIGVVAALIGGCQSAQQEEVSQATKNIAEAPDKGRTTAQTANVQQAENNALTK